jgi:hypothetical protein
MAINPNSDTYYKGNQLLKKANVPQNFTEEQIKEYLKCAEDPEYFCKQYVQIVTLDKGVQPFKMYNFQKEMVNTFHKNRFTICKIARQSGKSTTVLSYLLHYVLFNPSKSVAILANKGSLARELLGKLQLSYENLPLWLQQGVVSWNKGSLELENGSKVISAATSSSAIRGMSFNVIFIDEYAFIPQHIAEQFFNSVYPTITSGSDTKVIIVSTPNGLNHFYKMWIDAQNKMNNYIPISVSWEHIPGRDEKWKEETIKNTSEKQFQQEFECVSGETLVNIEKKGEVPIQELYEFLQRRSLEEN